MKERGSNSFILNGDEPLIEFRGADIANDTNLVLGNVSFTLGCGEFAYLVNNAGITNDKLALRMSSEDFDSVISANLKSAFIGCREALKIMSKQRFGSVVNISSIVGERGNAGQVNYSASKGGLIAMTKSFALESGARGVRFNALTPGFINTDMTSKLSDEVRGDYIKNIPLQRLGEAGEVANAVAFLLSDYASYITGEVLKVNGGLYM